MADLYLCPQVHGPTDIDLRPSTPCVATAPEVRGGRRRQEFVTVIRRAHRLNVPLTIDGVGTVQAATGATLEGTWAARLAARHTHPMPLATVTAARATATATLAVSTRARAVYARRSRNRNHRTLRDLTEENDL